MPKCIIPKSANTKKSAVAQSASQSASPSPSPRSPPPAAVSPGPMTVIEVPEYLVDELSNYLTKLRLEKPRVRSAPVLEAAVVSKVRGHTVDKRGNFTFELCFTDGSTAEVKDENTECEWLISQYLSSLGIRTAYLVCRVSSKLQSERSNAISLDAQESQLREALELYESSHKDRQYQRVKIVKIVGSAYKGIPKAIQAIAEAAKPKDAIFVWRVDRLSRNIVDFLPLLDQLNNRGVRIYSHYEKMFYHERKIEFTQALLDAQKDSAATSAAVKACVEYLRTRDGRVGSLPYGKRYRKVLDEEGKVVKKEIEDNPAEQDLIDDIVAKARSTMTKKSIAAELNKLGKTKRGRKWTVPMVVHVMKSHGIGKIIKRKPSKASKASKTSK